MTADTEARQAASAFLDGELSPSELGSTQATLEKHADLRDEVSRYQMIGACLRGERVLTGVDGIAARVSAELAADKVHVLAPKRKPRRWLKPVAGGAIAASVAVGAIMVVSQQAINPGADAGGSVIAGGSAVPELKEDVAREQLRRYLNEHSEFAARGGVNGALQNAALMTESK